MKEYVIPVRWEMFGEVRVTANSLDEAIETAYDAELPGDSEYIDGSFEVEHENIELYPENLEEEDTDSNEQ